MSWTIHPPLNYILGCRISHRNILTCTSSSSCFICCCAGISSIRSCMRKKCVKFFCSYHSCLLEFFMILKRRRTNFCSFDIYKSDNFLCHLMNLCSIWSMCRFWCRYFWFRSDCWLWLFSWFWIVRFFGRLWRNNRCVAVYIYFHAIFIIWAISLCFAVVTADSIIIIMLCNRLCICILIV